MNEYKLFGNMNYTASGGMWQLCLVVDNRFGYVGITEEQHKELLELEKQVYSKPINEILGFIDDKPDWDTYFTKRDERIMNLRKHRINDIWVQCEGNKVIGFVLKPIIVVSKEES